MKYITVQDGTLLEQVKVAFPDSTTTTLRSWIEQKRIFVNGRPLVRSNTNVVQGSVIELAPKPLPQEGPLKIVYEDADLIVIEKPSGLLSVADEKNTQPSVHAWIKHRYPDRVIPVVHRLDRDTSGLMLFALNSESFRKLKEMLAKRHIKRVYRALVEGKISENGRWENYLREDVRLVMRICPRLVDGAVLAVTHYTIVKVGEAYTLIDCALETGKKNQIRVQASHAGHPVAGDEKYGSKGDAARRLCLHARLLEFEHPITKKKMFFESPVPAFFERLCK